MWMNTASECSLFMNGSLACNIDVTQEPGLKGKIKPYIIKTIGHKKVAVIGKVIYLSYSKQQKTKPQIVFQVISVI